MFPSSGDTVSEPVEKTPTTVWGNYSHSWATNPDTGVPFIWDDIVSLQVGISLREDSVGKETFVTQVATTHPPAGSEVILSRNASRSRIPAPKQRDFLTCGRVG